MQVGKLHPDELDIDTALVARLVASQFPEWAALPVERVPSSGTDNAIFRLGDELAARLPRTPTRAAPLAKEREWLPRLAPLLPLEAPVPIAKGEPGEGFPLEWSVCRWCAGENATPDRIGDLEQAARDLARFVAALQRIDPAGGPPPGAHNYGRGEPLANRDASVRAALADLHGEVDVAAAAASWDESLATPVFTGAPVWIHGDIAPGNLLVRDGQLSAVIDFGCLGVGDPACDLLVGWTLLGDARSVLRAELGVDDATWTRGRGWALSMALIALPYYRDTNPIMVADAHRTIAAVLADA